MAEGVETKACRLCIHATAQDPKIPKGQRRKLQILCKERDRWMGAFSNPDDPQDPCTEYKPDMLKQRTIGWGVIKRLSAKRKL